jgi:hypothetical protein
MQWRIVERGCRKITSSRTEVPIVGMVGSYIDSVRGDRHRLGEIHLLPARGRLSRERCARQERSSAAPKIANVSSRVKGALIKANPADSAVAIRPEPDAQLHG